MIINTAVLLCVVTAVSTGLAVHVSATSRLLAASAVIAQQESRHAQERLRESLVAQGRAQRLAGKRWEALAALADAAKIKTGGDLRREAIEALATPGVRLRREIRFGSGDAIYGFRDPVNKDAMRIIPHAEAGDHEHDFSAQIAGFSPKGALLAVGGNYAADHPVPATPNRSNVVVHTRIVVFHIEDGHVVDRIEQGESLDTGELRFRPGSTTLVFQDFQKGHEGLRVRDPVEQKDLGFIARATRAEFSHDGAKLVVERPDGIAVLDAHSLREERSRAGGVLGAVLSNDELLIVEGRLLKGWNPGTGAETFVFPLPERQQLHGSHVFESIVTLVDSTPAGAISLWDLRTGQRVARLDDAAPDGFGGIRRSDSGPLLAFDARSQAGEIVLYDILRQQFRGRVEGVIVGGRSYNMPARSALSPDARLLAAPSRQHILGDFATNEWPEGSPHTINLWDVETRRKVASLPDCDIPFWSPDSRHIATVTLEPNGIPSLIKVWEVTNPTATCRLDGPVRAVSGSPDGRRLAADDRLWDLDGPELDVPRPRALPLAADFVAFAGTGALFAAALHKADLADQFERPVPFWQLAPTRRELGLPTFEGGKDVSYRSLGKMAALSPDGRIVAMLWQREGLTKRGTYHPGWQQIELWELSAPKPLGILWREPLFLTFKEDGSCLSEAHSDSHTVLHPRRMVFSADSKKLAVAFAGSRSGGGPDGGVVVYDVPGLKAVRWLGPAAECAVFSANGSEIYYGDEKGRLHVGTAAPVQGERQLVGEHDNETSKSQLLAGNRGMHGPVGLAQIAPSTTWPAHRGGVLTVALSADGQTLASGGDDRMIRLWEVSAGRSLAEWEAHDANVTALAFRPNGTLVSGAADGILKIWNLPLIHRELAAMGLDW